MADTPLPTFDGRQVDAASLAFSGTVPDNDVLHVEDEVVLVVKGKVTGVKHGTNQFGVMKRVHSIKLDHAIAADEVTAERIEKEIKRLADEAAGQESLDDELEDA